MTRRRDGPLAANDVDGFFSGASARQGCLPGHDGRSDPHPQPALRGIPSNVCST
ncbi:MAG: hypothetical protein QOG25_3917 [Acetobacteraceae bacterium]|jgi:hypothetical protein|nr:hypothetical protein [Acetobacteraceae bacterium]